MKAIAGIVAAGFAVTSAASGPQADSGGVDLSKLDPAVVAEGVKMLQTMTSEERKAALAGVREALGQSFGKDADLSGLSVDTKALEEGVSRSSLRREMNEPRIYTDGLR